MGGARVDIVDVVEVEGRGAVLQGSEMIICGIIRLDAAKFNTTQQHEWCRVGGLCWQAWWTQAKRRVIGGCSLLARGYWIERISRWG